MLKTPHWYRFYLSFSPGCDLNARVFWWTSCTSARHAGSFDCMMTSLILITMDNGRGHCAHWQSCKVPNQTHRGMKKIRKMFAVIQIKICAEYRDMLPRPRLVCQEPGLRPIGRSPGVPDKSSRDGILPLMLIPRNSLVQHAFCLRTTLSNCLSQGPDTRLLIR